MEWTSQQVVNSKGLSQLVQFILGSRMPSSLAMGHRFNHSENWGKMGMTIPSNNEILGCGMWDGSKPPMSWVDPMNFYSAQCFKPLDPILLSGESGPSSLIHSLESSQWGWQSLQLSKLWELLDGRCQDCLAEQLLDTENLWIWLAELRGRAENFFLPTSWFSLPGHSQSWTFQMHHDARRRLSPFRQLVGHHFLYPRFADGGIYRGAIPWHPIASPYLYGTWWNQPAAIAGFPVEKPSRSDAQDSDFVLSSQCQLGPTAVGSWNCGRTLGL